MTPEVIPVAPRPGAQLRAVTVRREKRRLRKHRRGERRKGAGLKGAWVSSRLCRVGALYIRELLDKWVTHSVSVCLKVPVSDTLVNSSAFPRLLCASVITSNTCKGLG